MCQNCGAPAHLDSDQNLMVCDYCHSTSALPVDENGFQLIGETAWPCPVCKTRLSNARVELHDLLYCTACFGILVTMEDFMPLVDDFRDHRDRGAAAHLAQHAGAGSNGGLDCPLCGRAMNHHAHGGGESGEIMIDSCEICFRIWLDRATLAKLVLTPAPQPWTPAQPEPDLEAELRRRFAGLDAADPRSAAELALRVADLARQIRTYRRG